MSFRPFDALFGLLLTATLALGIALAVLVAPFLPLLAALPEPQAEVESEWITVSTESTTGANGVTTWVWRGMP